MIYNILNEQGEKLNHFRFFDIDVNETIQFWNVGDEVADNDSVLHKITSAIIKPANNGWTYKELHLEKTERKIPRTQLQEIRDIIGLNNKVVIENVTSMFSSKNGKHENYTMEIVHHLVPQQTYLYNVTCDDFNSSWQNASREWQNEVYDKIKNHEYHEVENDNSWVDDDLELCCVQIVKPIINALAEINLQQKDYLIGIDPIPSQKQMCLWIKNLNKETIYDIEPIVRNHINTDNTNLGKLKSINFQPQKNDMAAQWILQF